MNDERAGATGQKYQDAKRRLEEAIGSLNDAETPQDRHLILNRIRALVEETYLAVVSSLPRR